jgi:hypothetical protein
MQALSVAVAGSNSVTFQDVAKTEYVASVKQNQWRHRMNNIITLAQMQQARELASKATQGTWYTVGPPWMPHDCGTWIIAGSDDPHAGIGVADSIEIMEWPADQSGPDYSQSDTDMAHIANAHNLLPSVLDTVDLLREQLKALATNCVHGDKGYYYCCLCNREGEKPDQIEHKDWCDVGKSRTLLAAMEADNANQ